MSRKYLIVRWHGFGLIICVCLLQGCGIFTPREAGIGESIEWKKLPGWQSDRHAEAWPALLQQCPRLSRNDTSWQTICAAAASASPPSDSQARLFFEQWFVPHQIFGQQGKKEGLITGYFEPLLIGRYAADERFRYPIYQRPENLLTIDIGALYPDLKGKRLRGRLEGNKIVPYYSRAEIDVGSNPLSGNEILWVDDKEALFFLHIQGSGRVRLSNGEMVAVGYADQNGHPYRSIGRELIDMGELKKEDVTLFTIRQWLLDNPQRAQELLNKNPSYVFFTLRDEVGDGPIGSLNVALTEERSAAVDRKIIPLGTPIWLETELPNTGDRYQRLLFAQDTGGAINGPVRADVFFGHGKRAERLAGEMKQKGRLFALLPKPQ